MLSRSSRISPSSVNIPSSLFTLCRVQPIIAARSPWVSGEGSRIAPSGKCLARFVRDPGEARREAPGDVEEVELLDVVGEPPQLRGERGEERVADRRLGREQLAELGPRQDRGLRRLDRDRRRRARRPVEQCQLAEDVAGPERREDRLVAGVARQHDLDRPRHDDEQRVARVAEMEDDLAASESPGAHAAGDPIEAGGIEPGEERHCGQGFGQWAGRDHEPHPTPAGNGAVTCPVTRVSAGRHGSVALPAGRPPARRGNIRAMPSESVYP